MLQKYQQSRNQKYMKNMKADSHYNIELKIKSFRTFEMIKNKKSYWRDIELQIGS